MPSARSPILQRLRAETALRHAEMEAALPLHNGQLTRATYQALLLRFWGFYKPLEQRLHLSALYAQPNFDYGARLKSPKLEHDLHDLGITSDMLLRAPQCRELPVVTTLPQLLGCLYVIEGATLGGQVITRQLQANAGLLPHAEARFFNGYGADTGPHWKATGAFLTERAEAVDQDDAIVASANDTFYALGRWVAGASFPEGL
ncbi:biliverdin-producing heme oxygenase [Gemmatimonas sp.]|uniref:biliverdin-producing heme oxygenase n=1 Tax=Gemmatimonas sp. TaxID=1962908 RepID=UPI00286E4C86|nr:biliverdin-producing heme oxygenase [Gemmatimonas sp.]